MVHRILSFVALTAVAVGLSGCFSLTNFQENVRQINHYGKELHDMRLITNKYFMDYDQENPFED